MNLRLWAIMMRVNGRKTRALTKKTNKDVFIPIRKRRSIDALLAWGGIFLQPLASSYAEYIYTLTIEGVLIMSAERFMDLAQRIKNNSKLIHNQRN